MSDYAVRNGYRSNVCRTCINADQVRRRAEKAKQGAATGSSSELRQDIRSDLMSAMLTGRSRRALHAARQNPDGLHKLRHKDGSGYYSITEFATRCIETEAVRRVARTCESHADAAEFIHLFEQDTTGSERLAAMHNLARTAGPRKPHLNLGEPEDEDIEPEFDPFEDSFGDWAPSWATTGPLTARMKGQTWPTTLST
ncbi:MAG TPA: hypothetical protein VNS79_02295 [Sphingobium sp.]|nr:hypothetical protein [Sphingobium sp.]